MFIRFASVIAFALLTGIATYAFTASNQVSASNAGQGTGAIVGYSISNSSYTLDVTSPQTITQVAFTLNAAPASTKTVRARVGTAGFASCSLSSSSASTSTWACPLSGVSTTNTSIPTLRVVAAQ